MLQKPLWTTEGQAESQGTSLLTQCSPIGKVSPFQAGVQAPPIYWETDSQPDEPNAISKQNGTFAPTLHMHCTLGLMFALPSQCVTFEPIRNTQALNGHQHLLQSVHWIINLYSFCLSARTQPANILQSGKETTPVKQHRSNIYRSHLPIIMQTTPCNAVIPWN